MTTHIETIVVQRALDEVAMLQKQINKLTTQGPYIGVVKGINNRPVDSKFRSDIELNTAIMSAHDSIQSRIDRFHKLQAAITLSNATTNITINGKTMTIAEALQRKRYYVLEENYLNGQRKALVAATNELGQSERNVETEIADRVRAVYGNEKLPDVKQFGDEVEQSVRDLMGLQLSDPCKIAINLEQKIADLESFMSQVDSEMVICNSGTTLVVDFS